MFTVPCTAPAEMTNPNIFQVVALKKFLPQVEEPPLAKLVPLRLGHSDTLNNHRTVANLAKWLEGPRRLIHFFTALVFRFGPWLRVREEGEGERTEQREQ